MRAARRLRAGCWRRELRWRPAIDSAPGRWRVRRASGHVALIELFLSRGAAIDARNLVGTTALYGAAENERHASVTRLLAHGADPDLPGPSGVTPLAAAAFKGNGRIVETLLARGADPNVVDRTGKSAMTYAAARAFTFVIRRLLDAGVDPNRAYGNDLTALMWAAGHDEGVGSGAALDAIALLLDAGAAIDPLDDRGRTALMIAAELGRAEIVALLLERGADRTIADKAGKRALDLAGNEGVREQLAGEVSLLSQARVVIGAGLDIVLGDREHQIGHARIVAARASAEVHHGPVHVFLRLAGEARLGAFALVFTLVATGATERDVGAQRPRRDIGRRPRLLQIGPALLREEERQGHHVAALESLRQRRHDVVLARAALVIAQLQVGVALVLTPDHRGRLLLRDAVLPVTGCAELCLLRDRIGASCGGEEKERSEDDEGQGTDEKRAGPCGPAFARNEPRLLSDSRHQSSVKAMMVLPRL